MSDKSEGPGSRRTENYKRGIDSAAHVDCRTVAVRSRILRAGRRRPGESSTEFRYLGRERGRMVAGAGGRGRTYFGSEEFNGWDSLSLVWFGNECVVRDIGWYVCMDGCMYGVAVGMAVIFG